MSTIDTRPAARERELSGSARADPGSALGDSRAKDHFGYTQPARCSADVYPLWLLATDDTLKAGISLESQK